MKDDSDVFVLNFSTFKIERIDGFIYEQYNMFHNIFIDLR